ncbi:MAG: hypothetical protein NVV59_00090 [Chitinophagaceae bacterium]|nr:hypothetical protein [Chitinophagaceae bacterium]
MWEEFVDAVDGMCSDALQDVFGPGIGFDTMHLAGAQQGVEHAAAFGGFMATGK